MIKIVKYLLIFFGVVILFGVILSRCNQKKEVSDKELSDLYGCISVVDCLSKYNFESARTLASKEILSGKELDKIVRAEVIYNIKSDEVESAIVLLNEHSWHYETNKKELLKDMGGHVIKHYEEIGEEEEVEKWKMKLFEALSQKEKVLTYLDQKRPDKALTLIESIEIPAFQSRGYSDANRYYNNDVSTYNSLIKIVAVYYSTNDMKKKEEAILKRIKPKSVRTELVKEGDPDKDFDFDEYKFELQN